MGLFICSHLLQEEDSLIMVGQNLCALQNAIRSHTIVTFSFKEQFKNSWLCRRSLGYLLSGSRPPVQCQVRAASHGVGLESNQILVGYAHRVCATNALTYSAGRDSIVDQVTGLVFSFLFRYHAECFPVPKMLEHRDEGSM